MLSRIDRIGLMVASLLMAIGALCNAQIPVILGKLGTAMEVAHQRGTAWGVREALSGLQTS